MNKLSRILHDIKQIEIDNLKDINIYYYAENDNIQYLKIMIIGPENTPYYGGFYFFDLIFPEDYPFSPPKITFRTTDGHIRFNPNLYKNGKVCLSIINTWNGPSWTPCCTLSSVLLTLKSFIFIDQPLINEPKYEQASLYEIDLYNTQVEHYNIKFAIIEMIENELKDFAGFSKIMCKFFIKNYNNYIYNSKSLEKKRGIKQYCFDFFSMKCTTNFKLLTNKLKLTKSYIYNKYPYLQIYEKNKPMKLIDLQYISKKLKIDIYKYSKINKNKLINKTKKELIRDIDSFICANEYSDCQ